MTGRWLPQVYFIYLSVCMYIALELVRRYVYDGPWIDRIVVGQIAVVAAFTVSSMSLKTLAWTIRGLGIWGFMGAILILYSATQLVEFGALNRPVAQWIVNIWRSPLVVGGSFMLYGYYRWTRGTAWDDRRREHHR